MDDFDDRFGADCQVKVINHQIKNGSTSTKTSKAAHLLDRSLVAAAVDYFFF